MTTTEYDSKKSQVFPIRTFQISTITDIFTTQRAHHFIYLSVNKAKLSSKGDISIAYIIIYNIMAQLITKTFYLGNFSSIIFSLLVIQSCNANINARNVNWGIQIDSIKSTGFSFVEKRLNAPVGSLIARYPVLGVSSVELVDESVRSVNSFVKVNLTNSNFLEFTLARPLSEFREENWAASIEVSYRIYCSSAGVEASLSSLTYTFMVIILDGNSYPPQFSLDNIYEINVTLPWSDSKLNKEPFIITDRDINFEYANITATCIEHENYASCDNFNFVLNEPAMTDGYVHYVDLYFSENSTINSNLDGVEVGSIFLVGIMANDSIHYAEKVITITVTKILQGKAGLDGESSSKFPVGPVAGAGTGIALLLGLGFAYTMWKNRQTKNILRKLTETEIREFLDGTTGFGVGIPKRSVDCNTPILALPYNKAFEIPRDLLRIDETTVLGSGFFGIVMKGSVLNERSGESVTVAVKAVKRNVGVLYFKALLSELKIMAFIGKHNNIVSLVGACTHSIRKREVFIAVEFCALGNLHNYLRSYRTSFVNLIKDGKLCAFSGNYAYNRKGSYTKQITTLELIKWSTQIANGLDYLSSVGVIHGDLATRNILLDEKMVAKIADFGLSRRLIDVSSYYYTKQSQAPLPWKWMAIESLKDMKFSVKSDIWSMGIVFWEIFSLGQTPYPGLNWEETFVDRLEKGLRPPQPQYSTDELYEVMRDCWTEDPHHRPAIFDIKRILEAMANALLNQGSGGGYVRVIGDDKTLYIGDSEITAPRVNDMKDEGNYVYGKLNQADC